MHVVNAELINSNIQETFRDRRFVFTVQMLLVNTLDQITTDARNSGYIHHGLSTKQIKSKLSKKPRAPRLSHDKGQFVPSQGPRRRKIMTPSLRAENGRTHDDKDKAKHSLLGTFFPDQLPASEAGQISMRKVTSAQKTIDVFYILYFCDTFQSNAG